MDSAAQLALMSKAQRVFGTEQTFLSFPVTPLAFARQDLDLLSADGIPRLIEFSVLANRIPEGAAWVPDDDRHLWELYGQVLQGEYALSARNEAEEAAYLEACAVLYTAQDGVRIPTPAALAYRSHRDLYLLQQQQYLAARLTHDSSQDAAQHAQWNATDEPALRRAVEDALVAWEQQGYRYEVETAEAKVRLLGAKSPSRTQAEWMDKFEADLSTFTRAIDGLEVYPTTYAPANALDDGAWRPFRLSGEEIAQALAQAPEELRQRLGGGDSQDIVAIDFEFSSAALVRPWFSPEAFSARFWKFDEGQAPLCDGASPPSGRCTGYPAAVVFARNIRIERKATAAAPSEPVQPFVFDLVEMPMPESVRIDALERVRRKRDLREPLVFSRGRKPQLEAMILSEPEPPIVLYTPMVSRVSRTREAFSPGLRRAAVLAVDDAGVAELQRNSIRKLQDSAYQRVGNRAPTLPSLPPEAPPDDASIYILAFICKALPKCPDPDESLAW